MRGGACAEERNNENFRYFCSNVQKDNVQKYNTYIHFSDKAKFLNCSIYFLHQVRSYQFMADGVIVTFGCFSGLDLRHINPFWVI